MKLPFNIRFFQINNDQLSARFLAKFIAFRFRQGFTVRAALKPIRKDLRLSKKLARRLHYKDQEMRRTKFQRSGAGELISLLPLYLSSLQFSRRLDFASKNYAQFDIFFLAAFLQQKRRSFSYGYKFLRLF